MFLKTDGAGNLSFSSDLPTTSFTGATVETSIADSDLVLIYDDSATTVRKMTKANLVAGIGASAGQVIQVVQTIKTDAFSTSSTSMVDITGFSVSITPSSASNKVLVLVNVGILSNSIAYGTLINLLRGATVLTSNTSGGSADTLDAWNALGGGGTSLDDRKFGSASLTYLDSPSSTSSLTYKCQLCTNGGSSTGYFNRWALNTDHASVSSITLMEIKG